MNVRKLKLFVQCSCILVSLIMGSLMYLSSTQPFFEVGPPLQVVFAQETVPNVYIDPPLVAPPDYTYLPGDAFAVNIMINDVTDLKSWQIELSFAEYVSVLSVKRRYL